MYLVSNSLDISPFELTDLMTADSRLSDITYAFLNPRVPTPPVEPEFLANETPLEAADIPVGGLPPTIAPTASFQFVQEDELAEEEEVLEEAIAEAVAEEASADVEVTETITEVTVNGHTVVEDTVTVTTTTEVSHPRLTSRCMVMTYAHQVPAEASAALNWAETEDDGGLPSLASLHDRFGSSATGTPAAVSEPLPTETHVANGNARAPAASAAEEDGFQAATRGGRGGRGRGGYRGGDRGGYRGGFRGGERGGRGEHRGGRGFRGGERGGYRGRGSGDWRGGEGGEFRGRGRGRGRGGASARLHTARVALIVAWRWCRPRVMCRIWGVISAGERSKDSTCVKRDGYAAQNSCARYRWVFSEVFIVLYSLRKYVV